MKRLIFVLTAISVGLAEDVDRAADREAIRGPHSGRVTEVFVFRNDHWVNPGWHMDGGS